MSGVSAGTQIPFQPTETISRDALRRYADASGDLNPIHLDDAKAVEVGLPGVIAHGMLVAAYLAGRALEYARESTGQPWRMKRFNSRFRAMVFPGETIACGGQVKSAGDELTLDLQARNQKGEVTTTATAVLVPGSEA